MRFFIATFIAVIFTCSAKSQENANAMGSRFESMGGAGGAVADVWSTNNNQAALSFLKQSEVSVFYKNNFGISELTLNAIASAIKTDIGTLGLSLAHFGFKEYNENKLCLALSKKLWKNISLSAQINYQTVKFDNGYRNANAICGEIGAMAKISSDFYLGMHIVNPTQSAMSFEKKEKLPSRYRIGIAHKPTSDIIISVDFENHSKYDFVFNGGIEFYLIQQFCLRAGISSKPSLFSFGGGYIFKNLDLNASYSYHNTLGSTTSVSVSYKFGK